MKYHTKRASQSRVLTALTIMTVLLVVQSCAVQPVDKGDLALTNFLAAELANRDNDGETALQYLERSLVVDPTNVSLQQAAFNQNFRLGNFDRAIRLAVQVSDDPDVPSTASMILALRALKQGDVDAVERYLSGALGLGLDSIMAPVVRGWARIKAGGDAVGGLQALKALDGVSAFRSFRQIQAAYMLDYTEQTAEAEEAYKLILGGGQLTSVQPIIAYGRMLERLNRGPEAEALYTQFNSLLGGNGTLKRAIAGVQNGQVGNSPAGSPETAAAVAFLTIATELSRDGALEPGLIYARFGTYLDPNIGDGHMLVANIFQAYGDSKAQLSALRDIPKESAVYGDAQLSIAFALQSMGQIEEAEAHLRAMGRRDPNNPDVWSSLGDLMRIDRRYDAAIQEYDKAVALIPTPQGVDYFLFFTRAICHDLTGSFEKAEADLLKALEIQPDQPDVLNYLGYSWVDRGVNIERAKDMIDRAVAQRPNDGAIIDSQGWVHFRLGEYDAAVVSLERAVVLEPSDPEINDHLGDAYWMVGRTREARYQWRRAMELSTDADVQLALQEKLDTGLHINMAEVPGPEGQ